MLIGLVALGGMVACIAWFMHGSAPVPKPVAAARPTAAVMLPPPPPNDPPAVDDSDQPATDPRQQFGQAMLAMMNDPQMQQNMTAMAATMTDALFGDLFSQMNLSPDQTTAVNDLMAQRAQAANAVFMNALQQGLDPVANRDQLQQQIQQAQAATDQGLRATLGDANFQQFQARDQQLRQSFQNGGGFPGGAGG